MLPPAGQADADVVTAYPPIHAHGVIGDRRTAALVAADGTLDWLCLPDYADVPAFGALLDVNRGGYWRMGPRLPTLGRQRYVAGSLVLSTTWILEDGELELVDAMAWPTQRPPGSDEARVIVRRLRSTRGAVRCRFDLWPRDDFGAPSAATPTADGALLRIGDRPGRLWTTFPVDVDPHGARADLTLGAGEEAWAVLSVGPDTGSWSIARAASVLDDARAATAEWGSHVRSAGPRADRVRRSAQLFHLLSYGPAGSVVAAPTTSLPERLGGDRNYDYRFAWVRDASLAATVLTLLGDLACAEGHLDWLASLDSSTDGPLRIVYAVNGDADLVERERRDVDGYRGSRPVRMGNRAAGQRQLDSLGYFVDCAWTYLAHGGTWRERYWDLVRQAAEYTAANWHLPDSGIWELPELDHYVSSKVMSWVALDRAVRVAERTGHPDHADGWRRAMDGLHADVLARGWSDRLGAFVQRYGAETVDASALLIPIMGFLPVDHPRVVATVERVRQTLAAGGLVHRFVPTETPDAAPLPIGQFEGAFLPATFWLATVDAMAGRVAEAEATLARAEAATGELRLFAEMLDGRSGELLGNYPLLFAQMEYVRSVLQIETTRRDSASEPGATESTP